MNILIVDDDALVRYTHNRFLEKHFNVFQAEDGVIGIEILRKEQDISKILLDVYMPEMDAFGFMRVIQTDPELSKRYFEIFLISNLNKEDILDTLIKQNIDMKYIRNIIKKPVDMQMLTAIVEL
jgi:CheY-like chemotaxis protein